MPRTQKPAIPIFHGRRWPVGIGNASKRLGVSRAHLSLVLAGKRKSIRLMAGYEELKTELEATR